MQNETTTNSKPRVLDTAGLMQRIGGKSELVERLTAIFSQSTEATFQQLEQSLNAGEWSEFKRIVHTTKGSVANLGGEIATETALELEAAAAAHDETRVAELVEQFKLNCNELITALRAFTQQTSEAVE